MCEFRRQAAPPSSVDDLTVDLKARHGAATSSHGIQYALVVGLWALNLPI